MGRSRLIGFFALGCAVYVGFGAVLFVGQRSMMYLPVADNPADDIPHERMAVGGESLKLWVVNGGAEDAVIYFGGNAEDVYYNGDVFRDRLPGRTVYLVNYRGYGGSSGRPTQQGLFDDALAVFDRVAARHRRVAVVGRSLGSGVATFLASRRGVERLVLVTAYDSAVAVARRLYPVYPVRWMLKDGYDSLAYVPAVQVPVRVITAARDNVIPREHTRRLVRAFRDGLIDEVVIAGAGHNDIAAHAGYWDAIAAFVRH